MENATTLTHENLELADAELEVIIGGGGSQTAGGGNTSLWGKIKSLMFGVDASFYD